MRIIPQYNLIGGLNKFKDYKGNVAKFCGPSIRKLGKKELEIYYNNTFILENDTSIIGATDLKSEHCYNNKEKYDKSSIFYFKGRDHMTLKEVETFIRNVKEAHSNANTKGPAMKCLICNTISEKGFDRCNELKILLYIHNGLEYYPKYFDM